MFFQKFDVSLRDLYSPTKMHFFFCFRVSSYARMNKPSTQSLLRKREIQFHAYIVKFQDDFFKMSDAKLSCRPTGRRRGVEAAKWGAAGRWVPSIQSIMYLSGSTVVWLIKAHLYAALVLNSLLFGIEFHAQLTIDLATLLQENQRLYTQSQQHYVYLRKNRI